MECLHAEILRLTKEIASACRQGRGGKRNIEDEHRPLLQPVVLYNNGYGMKIIKVGSISSHRHKFRKFGLTLLQKANKQDLP